MEFETDLNKYKSTLKLAKTPDWEEFSETAKITIAALVAVGGFGYAIYFVMQYLPG